MSIKWVVSDVLEHTCAHGLQLLHVDVEFDHDGHRHTCRLSHHLVDLANMPGSLLDNTQHLIEAGVAEAIASIQSRQELAALKGLTGEIESVERVLAEHAGGAPDHPPRHASQETVTSP